MTTRRQWHFPSLTPRNFAEYVEGSCEVTLFADRWKLHLMVRLKQSMFDRVEEMTAWEPLRRGLSIWFDAAPAYESFRIKRAYVSESTLVLECIYPSLGTLERIRAARWLRLARVDDVASGVLLEVHVRPTVHNDKKTSGDDVPF